MFKFLFQVRALKPFLFFQANVLNNKNVQESIHVYNLKSIIIVFRYVSAFRFPICSFISCLYDLRNVECTNPACRPVFHVCIFVIKTYFLKMWKEKEKRRRKKKISSRLLRACSVSGQFDGL